MVLPRLLSNFLSSCSVPQASEIIYMHHHTWLTVAFISVLIEWPTVCYIKQSLGSCNLLKGNIPNHLSTQTKQNSAEDVCPNILSCKKRSKAHLHLSHIPCCLVTSWQCNLGLCIFWKVLKIMAFDWTKPERAPPSHPPKLEMEVTIWEYKTNIDLFWVTGFSSSLCVSLPNLGESCWLAERCTTCKVLDSFL